MVREEPGTYGTTAKTMRVAYFDASALVKKYVAEEAGAAEVAALWRACQRHTTTLADVEIRGALARRRREGTLQPDEETSLAAAARLDAQEMILIDPSPPVLDEAHRLVSVHPLRTLDALHLASAILVVRRGPEDFVFVTGDHRLAAAARVEGLRVLVPE